MPVLECSCGMIMSVSAAAPRKTCIRCGGTNLRGFARRSSTRPALIQSRSPSEETPTMGTLAAIPQFHFTPFDTAPLSVAWPPAAAV